MRVALRARMERTDGTASPELANRVLEALRRALGRLPRHDRTLLRLIDDGVPLVDIAQALGEDWRSVDRRKTAILERLRAELGADSIHIPGSRELLSILDWSAVLAGGG
jgi:DNA-directed RNA polymerase specialized sigma24 family protein